MTKQEHIEYWLTTAINDFDTADYLLKGGKTLYALFYGHLHLEKICKAIWVQNNDSNIPPRTHNLVVLTEQAKIKLPEDDLEFLDLINQFQISSRYPEYNNSIQQSLTINEAIAIFERIKNLSQCLQEHLS